jgi:hypothetical protein
MSRQRSYLISFAAMAFLAVAGCQNAKDPAPQANAAPPQRALVVTSGNAGNVTVFLPTSDPENPIMLCSESTEVCPDCKAAAIKYFQTGVLDPKCARTGATRSPAFGPTPGFPFRK